MDLTRIALKQRRTRIVATLGPATSSAKNIRRLLESGTNTVRLNFSHGNTEEHRTAVKRVRRAAKELGLHVPILGDLSGPKIRTGTFAGGSIRLIPNENVVVTTRAVIGHPGLIPSQYKSLPKDVRKNQRLLLDDGNLELLVLQVRDTEIRCRVVRGGLLSDKKGINIPESAVSTPALTAKDRRDAATAVEMGLDYLALSFVRTASDVKALRRLLDKLGSSIPIIAKIEKPQALENIDAILEASDGIMIARGDLGVELPPERVPIVQTELIRLAREKGLPVIVATQMLQSMVEAALPTRAEANDVAGAAFGGADAVMLSAETAAGAYPFESVATMDRILREVEGYMWLHGAFDSWRREISDDSKRSAVVGAIGQATAQLSRDLSVHAIVVPTQTGTSVRAVSANRPAAPIVAVTRSPEICRLVALYWGVVPVQYDQGKAGGEPRDEVCRRIARDLCVASTGDRVLMVAGFKANPVESHPAITVLTL